MLAATEPALLVLEDGTILEGEAWGKRGETFGEIVFTTGMTGYQETLTDPSYHKQIVIMTAPHIGNTGMNEQDPESRRIWVAGLVARDPAPRPSNWRSTGSLDEALDSSETVGISQLDTRYLTRHIRSVGSMKAGIFSGISLPKSRSEATDAKLIARVRNQRSIHEDSLTSEVSTDSGYTLEPETSAIGTVVAIDMGIKSMTPIRLTEQGFRVHVIPANSSIEDVPEHNPDGVFFSNGPGDPKTAVNEISLIKAVLDRRIPFFGICLGNQLLGRALGFDTYKLTFGHRGINQPVKDLTTGKVEITAQNHGFAVDAQPGTELDTPYGRVQVSHLGLNDSVVEGLSCLDVPAFSVQYHPEAAAGPHDSAYLFDRFRELILQNKENKNA